MAEYPIVPDDSSNGHEEVELAAGPLDTLTSYPSKIKQGPTPKEPPLNEELGVLGPLPFAGGFEKNELINIQDISIEQLTEMRRLDGQVRSLMRVLTLPIRSAGWDVVPGEDDAGEEAKFARQMFKLPPRIGGMSVPFSRFLKDQLLALVEGFSLFEEVYQMPTEGPLAGKYTLRKAAHRDSQTVRFLVDDKGGFNGFRQRVFFMGHYIDVIIPRYKAFYYAANEEENPFYGVSYFLPAYYHWDKKRKLYYLSHVAAQFHAVPGRNAKMPPNPTKTQKDAVFNAIKNFGYNTAMLIPDGWAVDEFGKGQTRFDFLPLIDHHNLMMSKSILAQFIDLVGQKEGSYGLSADQSELFVQALEAIMEEISWGITAHLLPKFIDWNFGSNKYPEFLFNPLTDATKDLMRDIFKAIASAQTMNVTKDFMFELEQKVATTLQLDIDYDTLKKQFDQEKALEQKNAIAQLSDPAPPPGKQHKDNIAVQKAHAQAAAQANGNQPQNQPPGNQPPKQPGTTPQPKKSKQPNK